MLSTGTAGQPISQGMQRNAWNEANALQKMGSGCSGRGSGVNRVIEPIRCGCCVDAELKGCAWQGASMSLVEDRPVSDTEWLRDGAVRHRAGCRLWCCRAAMLMLILFVDSRYCVTDRCWRAEIWGSFAVMAAWFDERGEEAEDGKKVRRLFCTVIAADARARKLSNAPASVALRRNSQVRFEPRAGYGVDDEIVLAWRSRNCG
jgi:hypothetical protein